MRRDQATDYYQVYIQNEKTRIFLIQKVCIITDHFPMKMVRYRHYFKSNMLQYMWCLQKVFTKTENSLI
jgi:hypothetical protein